MNFLFLLLFAYVVPGSSKESQLGLQSSSRTWWRGRSAFFPKFLESPQNVTAVAGDASFLPCSVEYLGQRTVTWLRQRDLHIIAVGAFTFSADKRFKVFHPENSPDWTLRIKDVTPSDAGRYECQVNSDPKISRTVHLKVKEFTQLDDPDMFKETSDKRSSVKIEGPSERHLAAGSVLSLTCIVHHPLRRPPAALRWFRGGASLDYNSPRGGISVQTEKQETTTVSKLSISSLTSLDAGEYTCSPLSFPPAPVMIHVQRGDTDSAARLQGWNEAGKNGASHILVAISLLGILVASLGYV